ncbi:hypothetical protein AB0J83_11945 [Actinoplanes sp. NPDC049596]|uniref:hypothetical protein n=1 Tax=unclassified Actinoplanes TaxID=2626549 RepID=UPI0034473C5B
MSSPIGRQGNEDGRDANSGSRDSRGHGGRGGDAGAIGRVNVASSDAQAHHLTDQGSFGAAVSDDGRYVGFQSSAGPAGVMDAYVRDLRSGVTTRVGAGNGDSFAPTMTGDARWVAFGSRATDLVPGDTNGAADVFLGPRR